MILADLVVPVILGATVHVILVIAQVLILNATALYILTVAVVVKELNVVATFVMDSANLVANLLVSAFLQSAENSVEHVESVVRGVEIVVRVTVRVNGIRWVGLRVIVDCDD